MPRTEVFDRDHVIEQAKNIFWLKGYNATSMQDLVDVTGLNRSSIYNSFGNKMDLFQLTLKQYQKEGLGFFQVLLKSNLSGLECISKVFELTTDLMLSDTDRKGCMFINCHTEMSNQSNKLNAVTAKNQELLVTHFSNLIQKGEVDGSITNTQNKNDLAIYLTSALQGFRLMGMNDCNKITLENLKENIIRTLK